MQKIKKYLLPASGAVIGSLGGYLYWNFVGCTSGSCPITSNPINSTLYGAAMGGLFLSMFQSEQ